MFNDFNGDRIPDEKTCEPVFSAMDGTQLAEAPTIEATK